MKRETQKIKPAKKEAPMTTTYERALALQNHVMHSYHMYEWHHVMVPCAEEDEELFQLRKLLTNEEKEELKKASLAYDGFGCCQ